MMMNDLGRYSVCSVITIFLGPSLYPKKLSGSPFPWDGRLNVSWKVSPIICHTVEFLGRFFSLKRILQGNCQGTNYFETRKSVNTWKCLYNISNTRVNVSSGYPSTEKRVENTTCSGVFFKEIRGVWIADETLSLVFDNHISSQSKQKLRSKRRSKNR